jgi:hypothetical protein
MFDINAVLQKADLVAMVERAGGKLKQHGGGYSCACVLHGGDNPTALSVYQKDGKWLWNCFTGNCGGGDSITWVELWQFSNVPDKKERFKKACEFITGEKMSDPQAMKESAEARLEAARIERIAAQEREDARRKELRVAERHLLYHNNMLENVWMREAWNKCGIDDGMQDFWTLGGCNQFSVDGEYTSPTLTIPIFNEQRELMTIRHNILKPTNPKDKYRPDKAGLHSHPFLAFPEMGFDGGIIWVMEGEKKAMVTWTRSDSDWQCIGVPGQSMYNHLVNELRSVGQKVVVIPDPGAEEKATALAHAVGGRVLQVPLKIDDYILLTKIGKDELYKMQLQAVRA